MPQQDLDSNASTDSTAPNLSHSPRRLPVLRYVVDISLVAITFFVSQVIVKSFGPVENGFYCNDARLSFPYKGSTVTVVHLLLYCVLLPLVFVIITELVMLSIHPHERYSVYEYHRGKVQRFGIRMAVFYGYYFAFEIFVFLLTLYTKNSVGRLRPHFLTVCQPSYDPADCNVAGAFIGNYTCMSGLSDKVREARLSFFSGHSSFAFGAATFTVLYLQHRLIGHIRSRIIIPLIQTIVVSTALFIAVSRLFDYKHHWTDVGVGVSVGILTMVTLCRYSAGFRYRAPREVEAELVALDLEAERNQKKEKININASIKRPESSTGMIANRSFQWMEAYS
ncbi:unnamed protein product [Bursaphelenchus okinawaensis]|uniref:Phosphatidic acid phosphatase type 2/haloperoxidase domain-containing protein n=1 Tax=Bursaphelenchus okinawaensis TaxID=465554 RepID=A0A811K3B4_9BILA|nr:unnamed protein product [Bursaphelenchus okinawaensis]CAG9091315.1 unnamed protein product [Bursaphelenchus okinawaensis]